MPIIVGGKEVSLEQIKKPDATQEARSIVEEQPPAPPRRVVFNRKDKDVEPEGGNKLIVNGKSKRIGRKSQYLLDMMIIDEE